MKITSSLKLYVINLSMFLFLLFGVKADPPAGYYDSATGLTGTALRNALHNIIDDHEHLTYTDETRPVLAAADEDPNNSSNILDVYKNASYAKTNTSSWNQEHAWPKSYGFPDEAACNYPYTDCHHLFACDPNYNSSRGNIPYDFCLSSCTEYPALPLESGLANYRSGSGNTGSWEVWQGRRGDVARALFYLDVRYEGGTHGGTGCSEPDLILTNNKNLITTTDENVSVAYMGVLDALLQWHQTDPVDDKERHRNDVVFQYQGNRNPFIDHPEWVAEIWGSIVTPTPTATPTTTPTPTATPVIGVSPGDIVINEIDYDDPSIDTETFIELKNVSSNSIDLSFIQVLGFNGATSEAYFTFTPASKILLPGQYHVLGTQDDSADVSAYIDETMTGVSLIQNGPDGIYLRLTASPSTIIDSVSYEGDFVHPSGSTDTGNAGVDNPSSSFYSLSRLPDGLDTNNNSTDFVFQAATPGETNNAPTPTPTATPTPTPTPGTDLDPGDIVINEVDYEDNEIDAESFIELKNVSSSDINLSDLQVNGFNGGTSTTYFTYRPAVKILLPGEYHVLGTESESSDVAAFIDETMTGVSSLQNGPDGIFLSLFASPDTILDSVSYESAFVHPPDSTDVGDAGEDLSTDDGFSLSRIPDGNDTNDNAQDFILAPHTPGTANVTATPTPTPELDPGDIVINEIDYSDPETDDQSFLELKNISEKYVDLSTLQIVGISSGTYNLYFTYRPQSKSLAPGERHVLGTLSDSGAVAAFIDETMIGVSSLQNGPDDGVYLRLYYFPSIIIDSVSYDGYKAHPIGSPDAGDAGEDSEMQENVSLSRIPDGIDTNDNADDFKVVPSTPGGVNVTPTPTPFPPTSGLLLR